MVILGGGGGSYERGNPVNSKSDTNASCVAKGPWSVRIPYLATTSCLEPQGGAREWAFSYGQGTPVNPKPYARYERIVRGWGSLERLDPVLGCYHRND